MTAEIVSFPLSGRAVCKAVSNGESLVLRGKPVRGPPPEMTLNLEGLARVDGEDPFAFDIKEALRVLVIGKEVVYKISSSGSRQFGYAYVQLPVDGETNVAAILVKQGWARVKDPKKPEDSLVLLELEAKAAKRGVWSDSVPAHVTYTNFDHDPREFLNKFHGPVDAILEHVRDGSSYRVLLLYPEGTSTIHQFIVLNVSGIKAPIYRKDVPRMQDLIEPYAEEAKYFVEARLLHRHVKVVLESVVAGSNGTFMGSIQFPAGNIAESLLAEGLAKVLDWNLAIVTGGGQSYKLAEAKAKAKQLRLWRGHVQGPSAASSFDAIVMRILGPDLIMVEPTGTPGKEQKLQLSSVRGPKRQKNEMGSEIGYASEAIEFLRSRLIGKKVHVTIDYLKPAEGEYEERTCATIVNGDQNVAEALVSKGLATVVKHKREDQNRASTYDRLVMAEERAQKGTKGVHSTKELPVVRLIDASENAARARQYFSSFQRAGAIPGIVEYVSSGSRFKVFVPSQSTRVTFILSGIKTPRTARNSVEKSEPFGDDAAAFVTRMLLQHDVQVYFEAMDKVGGFIGSLFVTSGSEKINVASALLEMGYATINDYSAQGTYLKQLQDSENHAKKSRKGLWTTYDAEAEAAAQKLREAEESAPQKQEVFEVVVSDLKADGTLYLQQLGDGTKQLETLMSNFSLYHESGTAPSGWTPRLGEFVSALYSVDNTWYRAKVLKFGGQKYDIQFIDYGNCESLPLASIRPLPPSFSIRELIPQGKEARLAFVQFPEDPEMAAEALLELSSFIKADKLVALTVRKSNNILDVILYDQTIQGSSRLVSINEKMVGAGLILVQPVHVKRLQMEHRERLKNPTLFAATLRQDSEQKSDVQVLLDAQDLAKARRLGIWQYGDFTADDE